MHNEIEQQMMLKFLHRAYPVSRVKTDGKFRRGVILDDGSIYLLSNSGNRSSLSDKLNQILKKVFGCNEKTSRAVLTNFLQLKQSTANKSSSYL
jgi:hypothetical protein